jgi:glycine cleavage system aminomethyltransferase T
MAGHQGVELSGRYEDGEKVRAAVLEAGEKHGLRQGGTLAYFSAVTEGGWMASPFPAIFTSDKLRDYRKWLPADTWEAGAQLGGSFIADNLEAYYVTPWDLGVEGRIRFDHDFIGREALERQAKNPRRARRTLVWNQEDVARIFASLLEPGPACKLLRLPYASYAYQQYDAVRTSGGELVGYSTLCGYSANEAKILSLVMIDLDHAEIGTELVLTWGEPNGGSRKEHVERHRQTEVRVTVAPAPYAQTVREKKRQRVRVA